MILAILLYVSEITMYIEKYRYKDTRNAPAWNFEEAKFKRNNLLVGKSGCGKTRFLSTIFNLGKMISSEQEETKNGHWRLIYRHEKLRFGYELKIADGKVEHESLMRLSDDAEYNLIQRSKEELSYMGSKVPQLTLSRPAIALFKEDQSIQIAFNGFSLICRRNFDTDALIKARVIVSAPKQLLKKYEQTGLISMEIYNLPLSLRLFITDKVDKALFIKIMEAYQDVFPEFIHWQVRQLKPSEAPTEIEGMMPGVFFTENNVEGQILLTELSSGMLKVLLIITDILSAPSGSIYLIDEYENSLGINAIDFLPDLLSQSTGVQTFVTTHHPYLINTMPVANWQIMSRIGSVVSIIRGDTKKEIFEASAQEAFTLLMNDPEYSGL